MRLVLLALLSATAYADPASSDREPSPPPANNATATRDHAPPREKPHDKRLPSTRTNPRRDDTQAPVDK